MDDETGPCDAEDDCVAPEHPPRWLEGEPREERAHVFAGHAYFLKFHPECCPRTVMGDTCHHETHP